MQAREESVKVRTRLWCINGLNLLRDVSEEEMLRFAAITRIVERRRGDMIYLPGDASQSVYFLKEGRIKITGLSEDGHEVLLDIIGPGEIFGELGAIQETPRTTAAQALEDAVLCEVDREDFEEMLATNPQMSLKVLKGFGSRLKRIEAQLLRLISKDVPTRVREALVDLIDAQRTVRPEVPVKIGLTQQDVANLVGASRQETARALKELEYSGAVELRYRSIVVRTPDKLRDRALFNGH
ncbi:MAG TPA: Crp/Fnr family transcriptional regulator [Blastocatellia bacterium]|nr:Crp/Fnr family transcriptional regulator [Blastocatellia bacterium]